MHQWRCVRAVGEEGAEVSSDTGRPTVVVLGSINMDLVVHTHRVPGPGETIKGGELRTAPGGKGANQAVAAARLGASVRMVGRVGGDEFGDSLLAGLSSQSVDTSGVAVDSDHASGVAIILLDVEKENRIVVVSGANMECGRAEANAAAEAMEEAQVLMLQHEIPMKVNLDAARRASEAGTAVLWNPAPFEEIPEDAYRLIDVITPNRNEAAALTGVSVSDAASAERAALRLLERGVGAAVVTLGELGAVYATREESGYVVAPRVEPVDTVGAGDAFSGAMAVSLAGGRPLLDAVRYGVMAGTAAVMSAGAQDGMPDRDAVEAMLRRT